MVGEHVVDPGHEHREPGRVEANVEDACMGLMEPKHQLAEVAIIGDQHARLPPRDRQNLGVPERARVVPTDTGDVVPAVAEVADEPSVRTGIDQEFHAGATVNVFRSRSSAARA